MSKPIKMLRPGKFTAMNGKVVEFTEADLKATAAAYDPAVYAAPFVLGHPKHDSPAFGKIGAANFAEGFLWGDPAQVDPAFAEMVKAGKFDKVSLSLYEPTSPNNPVPGVYYPRHLGFLGAMPPAVKGLGTVSFGEQETGILEFGDWNDRTIARVFRNLKNFFIGKYGQDEADKILDEYDLESITQDAVTPDPQPGTCSACGLPCADCCCPPKNESADFAEQLKGGAMKLTAEQLATKETELNQREAALKTQENGKTHESNLSFAEGLVQEGKLLPANKAAVVAVLDFAAGVTEGDTIEFGEGDAKKTEAPLATIKTLFGGMPKIINFGEFEFGEEPGKKTEPIPGNIATFV
ncbi:MAG: hypothetical protein PVSMB11_03720 [Desulfuromonadaceae bacterium]